MTMSSQMQRPPAMQSLVRYVRPWPLWPRNMAIVLSCALLIAAIIVVPILFPLQAGDAETVATMAGSADSPEAFDGYGFMSLIYAHTNAGLRNLILFGFGSVLITMLLWWLRMPRTLAIAGFMLLAPLTLYLPFFVKDTFTAPLAITAAFLLTRGRTALWAKIAGVTIFYAAYAVIFRQYYFLIIPVWFFLVLFIEAPGSWRVVLLVAIPIVMVVIPKEIYDTLQVQRDMVNMARAGFAGEGNRSAFLNLVEPNGVFTFIVNFFYAAVRLNLPFDRLAPNNIFLFMNVCLYFWLSVSGMRSANRIVSWPAALFFAHIVVITIFEPDLGSYLRHASTAILLLAPSMAMWDSVYRQKTAGNA